MKGHVTHLLGYCKSCGASYPSPYVTDGICSECQKSEPQNDPSPYVEIEPWEFSKAAMREKLGVSGDEDA